MPREVYHARRNGLDTVLPFSDVYFVPEEDVDSIYLWFGPAVSFSWRIGLFPPNTYVFVRCNARDTVDQLKDYRMVVPLYLWHGGMDSPTLALSRYLTAYDERRVKQGHAEVDPKIMRFQLVEALSVLLHHQEAPGSAMPICSFCEYASEHMADLCRPFVRRCRQGVQIPAEGKLVTLRRKTKHARVP